VESFSIIAIIDLGTLCGLRTGMGQKRSNVRMGYNIYTFTKSMVPRRSSLAHAGDSQAFVAINAIDDVASGVP